MKYTLKVNKNITKNGISQICKTLNNHKNYKDVWYFQPYGKSGGGIICHKLNDENEIRSIYFNEIFLWIYVCDNSNEVWIDNEYIIFKKNHKLHINFQKDNFTKKEQQIILNIFNEYGLINNDV